MAYNYKVKTLVRGKWIPDPFSTIVRTDFGDKQVWGLVDTSSGKLLRHLTYKEANQYFFNHLDKKAYGEAKTAGLIYYVPMYPDSFNPED